MRSIGSTRKDEVVWYSQGKMKLVTTYDFVQWENINLIVKLMVVWCMNVWHMSLLVCLKRSCCF